MSGSAGQMVNNDLESARDRDEFRKASRHTSEGYRCG